MSFAFKVSGGLVGLLLAAATTQGAIVRATFNDIATGDLPGQAGGTGFAASSTWGPGTGSGVDVIASDLVAPGSTNFSPAQGGTAQKAASPNSTLSGAGSAYRNTTTLGNNIWFSFLLQPGDANTRVGLGFNNTINSTSSNPRILAIGTSLFVNSATGLNPFTLGQTALVVGQLGISSTGNDSVKLWVNPDVNALNGATPPAPTYSQTFDFVSGIFSVTVNSYTNTTNGLSGAFDMLTISDTATALADVTYVPEPATMGLLAITGLAALRRQRRASR